ncbi:MAG: hypothetical protein QNJ65_05655 [Xenococcaceae cyanobacterium MO_234.B1]|nr:hypothetical protein [Xenococcaceae cyanobacterium MO_234.B1]
MKLPIQSVKVTRKSLTSSAFGISKNILAQQFRFVARPGSRLNGYSECWPISSVRCEEFADLCTNDGCGAGSTPDGGVSCSCSDSGPVRFPFVIRAR